MTKTTKKVKSKTKKKATRTLKSHPLEKKSVVKKVEKVMKDIKNGLKVGGKIDMAFHGAGVTSHENKTIANYDDNFIWIDCENTEGEFYKFNRKTGKCVNDNTFGGFSRTIKPQ